jgi:hypothetical protein
MRVPRYVPGIKMFRMLLDGMSNVRRKDLEIELTNSGSQWYLLLTWPIIDLIWFFGLACPIGKVTLVLG